MSVLHHALIGHLFDDLKPIYFQNLFVNDDAIFNNLLSKRFHFLKPPQIVYKNPQTITSFRIYEVTTNTLDIYIQPIANRFRNFTTCALCIVEIALISYSLLTYLN